MDRHPSRREILAGAAALGAATLAPPARAADAPIVIKFHEVQKHTTISEHGHISYAVVVNKKFWEGLPNDLRGVLENCMHEATTYANDIAVGENQKALDEIKASGKTLVYALAPAEKEEWKKAMFVVHGQMEERVGKDTIQAVYKAAGFVVPA